MLPYLTPRSTNARPLVGVSACLLGTPVRYDGGHRHHPAVANRLAAALTLVPVCPEAEAGLGVPRPPVQLIASSSGPRALGREVPDLDVTESLQHFTARQIHSWKQLPLTGHVFKSRSPSCGAGSTPLLSSTGVYLGDTDGLYASGLKAALPWLVIVEDTQLKDSLAGNNFITRCRLVDELLYGNADLERARHHYSRLLLAPEDESLIEFARHKAREDFVSRFLALIDEEKLREVH